MSPRKLLLVDDREEGLEALQTAFMREDYELIAVSSGKHAIEIIESSDVDVVVTDLCMPDASGLDIVRAAKAQELPPQVIVITAYGTIESAVECILAGACNYLTKPVDIKQLRAFVAQSMEVQAVKRENLMLRHEVDARCFSHGLVGASKEMQALLEKIRTVSDTRATVLIEGESGTGKELVARALHHNSRRRNKPFLPIHCAALSETLIESELFGHEKGAFTGAASRKQGLFELADGGTIFLDEVGEIPISTQVKLLRFLEDKEFLRVGGIEPKKVDVRVIAATNRNLIEEVEEGRFREDLYYRLNVVRIEVPPLRARRSDIPLLVEHFLRAYEKEHGRPALTVTPEALNFLMQYHWPGNVRQLRNVVESFVLFARSPVIDVSDLPAELRTTPTENVAIEVGMPLDVLERKAIEHTLIATGGNRTRAAEMLGISRRTLLRKIKELGLEG